MKFKLSKYGEQWPHVRRTCPKSAIEYSKYSASTALKYPDDFLNTTWQCQYGADKFPNMSKDYSFSIFLIANT